MSKPTTPPRVPRLDLNPSSAERWTACTASPRFILDNAHRLPPEDWTFTAPGQTAHEVAAAFLQGRDTDPKNCPVPEDDDMRWHGWNYAEFVRGLHEGESTMMVERKLPLWYMPGRNAIVDAAVVNPSNMHIVDYKYGEGVIVSPERNLQATIYAKSVLQHTPVPKEAFDQGFPVSVHIYQPRSRNAEESPSHTWQTTLGEINTIAEEIALAATKILLHEKNPAAPVVFAPSEKACRWCAAKGFCEARQSEFLKEFDSVTTLAEMDQQTPNVLTEKQLAAVALHGAEMIKWIGDVQDYALTLVRGGGAIPGVKLVEGRGGNRYWSDPAQAEKLLAKTILKDDEIFTKKLIGPAAAEKLLGKSKITVELTNLIARPAGQTALAPEDDPRPPALINAGAEFEVMPAASE